MSDLDARNRDATMPKSVNLIQYAFNQYNNTRDTLESMKATPQIYRSVNKAREEYKKLKNETQSKDEQTPVVTAQDIKDEMYR